MKACRDGRLDPQFAARAIVTGVTAEAFKLNRVADGLQHASHEPVAAQRIVQTVFATADDLIPAKPSHLHLLLGLAARAGTPATVPAAIRREGDRRLRAAAAAVQAESAGKTRTEIRELLINELRAGSGPLPSGDTLDFAVDHIARSAEQEAAGRTGSVRTLRVLAGELTDLTGVSSVVSRMMSRIPAGASRTTSPRTAPSEGLT